MTLAVNKIKHLGGIFLWMSNYFFVEITSSCTLLCLYNAFGYEVHVKDFIYLDDKLVENAKWGQSFSNSSFVFTYAFMSLTRLVFISSLQFFSFKALGVL